MSDLFWRYAPYRVTEAIAIAAYGLRGVVSLLRRP